MFTRNRPATAETPSDHDFGNAFADLSVTGKATRTGPPPLDFTASLSRHDERTEFYTPEEAEAN
jgi:hypothetical protein